MPFRAAPDIVAEFLRRRFGPRWLHPRPHTITSLPTVLAAVGIAGGAAYDALVAATAMDHGARLRSLDQRAARTYGLVGADYDILS